MTNLTIRDGFRVEENGIQHYFFDNKFLCAVDHTKMVRYDFEQIQVQVYSCLHDQDQLGHVAVTENCPCDFGTGVAGRLEVWKDHRKIYDIVYDKWQCSFNKEKYRIVQNGSGTIGHIEIHKFFGTRMANLYDNQNVDGETKALILGATFLINQSWRKYRKIILVVKLVLILFCCGIGPLVRVLSSTIN